MIIQGLEIETCPDSGSYENIMHKNMATKLGLHVNESPINQRVFRMADSRYIQALGCTSAQCTFAHQPEVIFQCTFYIFPSLIAPVIMGLRFLEETETLTTHRHRVEVSQIPDTERARVLALGNPKSHIWCSFNGKPVVASADTGSEIDLISMDFAKRCKLLLRTTRPNQCEVQMADGSVVGVEGQVEAYVSLGLESVAYAPTLQHRFYVLNGLTCDVVFGDNFVSNNDVFSLKDAFIQTPDCAKVETIFWMRPSERRFTRVFHYNRAPRSETCSTGNQSIKTGLGDSTVNLPQREFDKYIDETDAYELHRRELVRQEIEYLPPSQKDQAEDKENARIRNYEEQKADLIAQRMAHWFPSREELALQVMVGSQEGLAVRSSIEEGFLGKRIKEAKAKDFEIKEDNPQEGNSAVYKTAMATNSDSIRFQ